MKSEDVDKWIASAESDFELAQKGKSSQKVLYITLCFHSQQTVEKVLKAILIHIEKPYPKTHNINLLLGLLEQGGIEIPTIIRDASEFTKYTDWKYPDDVFEVEREEYKHTISIAGKTLEWAKSIIYKTEGKLF